MNQLQLLANAVACCRILCSHQREFKYSKTSAGVRDEYFNQISHVEFSIRTIVMDKQLIYSPKFRGEPKTLKSYAIRQLLTKSFGRIRNAKVFIDGHDTKAFGAPDSAYIMRMANGASPGAIHAVRFVDSRVNEGIQLADMVAGAIQRGVRTHRPKEPRHLNMIRHRTFQPEGTFWRFT